MSAEDVTTKPQSSEELVAEVQRRSPRDAARLLAGVRLPRWRPYFSR